MPKESILIVAGEASGDLHGARLLTQLQILRPEILPFGMGGDELTSAGLESIAHSSEIAIIGITEALKILPELEDAKIIDHRGDLMSWAPEPLRSKPVMGLLPDLDNAYITARIAFGMSMSAGVGQAMADLIIDGQPPNFLKKMMQTLSPSAL